MSLLSIKNRIRDGEIKTTQEFYRDVSLVFTNAIMYNGNGSEMYKMAVDIKGFSDSEFRHILSYDKEHLDRRKSFMSDSGTEWIWM
jgi:bromodomain-containing protein 8